MTSLKSFEDPCGQLIWIADTVLPAAVPPKPSYSSLRQALLGTSSHTRPFAA